MSLFDIFQQAVDEFGNNSEGHFETAADSLSSDVVGHGLAAAFRSNQTPPFSSMIGQLFGESEDGQKAGVVNHLLAVFGPSALAQMGEGVLGGLLPQGATQMTAEQAGQLTSEQAAQLAAHAERTSPSVIEQLGRFYAEHPVLVKTLGSAALTIALAKMREHQVS